MSVDPQAKHPPADKLRAYGLGQLDGAAETTVARHIETCADCRQAIEGQPADTFVNDVRGAAAGSGAGPVGTQGGAAVVPPGLAAHPDYEVERLLGEGGMGAVYLARHRLMRRRVVLKVIGDRLGNRPENVERFRNEIVAVAQLQHENIVAAYDAFQAGDLLVFAMAYVDGLDLAKLVEKKGPLPVAHACHYARQAALGLQHAFERGLAHRDIKPSNLMLGRDGKVQVLDFGLARVGHDDGDPEARLTRTGSMMGTPDYVAPEQVLDASSADVRADVYSLGCTLYFMLTGRPPFSASTLADLLRAHVEQPPPVLHEGRPDAPAELSAVVSKMLAKRPEDRYQKPIDVARDLLPFIKTGTKPLAPQEAVKPKTTTVEPAVVVPQAAPVPAGARGEPDWADLDDAEPAPKSRAERRPPVEEQPPHRSHAGRNAGLGIAAAVLAVVVAAALGVFRVKTKDGTLVLDGVPDGAQVWVDGSQVTIHRAGQHDPVVVSVHPDTPAKVEVRMGGFKVWGADLSLSVGERRPLQVRLEPVSAPTQVAVAPLLPGSAPPAAPAPAPRSAAVIQAAPEPDEGFTPLFNGKDLTGWLVERGDTDNWKVEDGAIVTTGTGFKDESWILSAKSYGDFTVRFEFQAAPRVNSGFALRAVPDERPPLGRDGQPHPIPTHLQVEIIGPERDGPATTGLVLGNGNASIALRPPSGRTELAPVGQWNRMEVESRGQSVRVRVNDKLVLAGNLNDLVNAGSRFPGLNRTSGRIGFQRHSETVRFRNIQIKEIEAKATEIKLPAAPARSEEAGFTPLFNGKDLAGWVEQGGKPEVWRSADGVLSATGASPSWLRTEKEYTDFDLRLEYRWPGEGGDSGVAFRFPAKRDPTVDGIEIQLIDEFNWSRQKKGPPKPAQTTGSLTHIAAATRASNRPAGQWNELRLLCVGRRVTVEHNGLMVNDVDMDDLAGTSLVYPGLKNRSGHIALQSLLAPVEYRNIRIKEAGLAEPPPARDVYVSLFNGKDLAGWSPLGAKPNTWGADKGVLYAAGAGGGWLLTTREYADFELQLDYRWLKAGGNSGVALRAPRGGNSAFEGMEIQLVDDVNWPKIHKVAKLQPIQLTGAVYDVAAPTAPPNCRPLGQWNSVRILCQGRWVIVEHNGHLLNTVLLDEYIGLAQKHPGLRRRTGQVGLQGNIPGQVARIDFRHIRIRDLNP